LFVNILPIKLFKNNRKEKINNYIKLFEKEVKNNKDRKRLLQELEEDEKKNDEEVNIIVDKFNEILRSHYIKDLNFFWRFFN
jgi:archaellum biogenesis ATPase FlaH